MEVVLPNGELHAHRHGRDRRTRRPGSDYKYGFGPWSTALFRQANFGIVTKMGFWLMPEPEAYRRGTVSVPKRTRHRARSSSTSTISRTSASSACRDFAARSGSRRRASPSCARSSRKPGGPSRRRSSSASPSRKALASWSCRAAVLRAREDDRGAMGIRAANASARRFRARASRTAFLSVSADRRSSRRTCSACTGSSSFGIPNMSIFSIAGGAHAAESRLGRRRPVLVRADDPAHRRGDPRSEPRARPGVPRRRHAVQPVLHAAGRSGTTARSS